MDNVFSSTYNFSEPQFDVYDRSFDEDEEEFEKRRKLYYPDCYSIIPSKEEVEHWIDNHAKKVEEIENQEANLFASAMAPRVAIPLSAMCLQCDCRRQHKEKRGTKPKSRIFSCGLSFCPPLVLSSKIALDSLDPPTMII
jgi:hypothetical protein